MKTNVLSLCGEAIVVKVVDYCVITPEPIETPIPLKASYYKKQLQARLELVLTIKG
ncbi:MAG: hypothetical protein LVT47_04190 [Cyanobacteria bacterium LVE1205-1]